MADCLREPALYVGDIDENVNLSLPPASGEEYIKRVVIEARKCADIVVADIDRTRLKEPTVNLNPPTGCMEAPRTLGPTLEWQQCQLSDFSNIRLYISRWKNRLQSRPNSRPKAIDISLPEISDEEGWVRFCSSSYSPTLNTVLFMSQPSVEQILEYLITHIEQQESIKQEVGRWLYALLVVLELPLNPDTCSSLRTLARSCSIIRSKKDAGVEVQPLNLFICLIARYFRQLDLADP